MRGTSKFVILISVLCILITPLRSYAHEGHEQKIKYYSEQIKAYPLNPENYLLRGIQYQSHNIFEEARRDFNKVIALEPDHVQVNYSFACLYLDNNRPDSALHYINRFIANMPSNEKGFLCRADIYKSQKKYELAGMDYQKAIDISTNPSIDLFFALSNNCKAAGDIEGARQVLDSALQTLGNIIPIREAAIEMAVELGSWDDAHRILDSIIADMTRKEVWYVMKAEIYEAENKPVEAADYYSRAYDAITLLNANYRNKESVRTLEQNILDRLNTFETK